MDLDPIESIKVADFITNFIITLLVTCLTIVNFCMNKIFAAEGEKNVIKHLIYFEMFDNFGAKFISQPL